MAVRVFTMIALIFGIFSLPVYSARLFDRRSDLAETPSITLFGWTVPLGGQPCAVNTCTDSLSSPGSNKTLAAMLLGRGTFNYTCEGAEPANAPSFVGQYTELYNVSALVSTAADPDLFHQLVQQLYEYDYADLRNSSIKCAGSIGTLEELAVVEVYELATFYSMLLETIPSPDNPDFDGLWAHSKSLDNVWELYRVEMVGGAVPAICQEITGAFDIDYAAEYWLYRA